MASDDELKDEELVDFEGSDYESGFDYDGELEALENEQKAIEDGGDSTTRRFESSPSSSWQKNTVSETSETSKNPFLDTVEPAHLAEGGFAISEENLIEDRNSKRGTETRGIEVERENKMEDVKEFCANDVKTGNKPELEDGELDETAMPHNRELVPEDGTSNVNDGPERKRRKANVTMEKKVNSDAEKNCLKEIAKTNAEDGQHTGSMRTMQHVAGVPSTGGRTPKLRKTGLAQGSLTLGIIGSGMPPASFGMAQGLGPFGRFGAHGRPSVHPQDILAQEHIIRAHALHLTRENLATAIMGPIPRPLGAGTLNPFLGLDGLHPRAQIPKHFLPQPDLMLGQVENLMRGQRAVLGMGRSSPGNKSGIQAELSSVARPLNFTGPSVPAVLQRPKNCHHVRGPSIRGGIRRSSGSRNAMHGAGIPLNPNVMLNATAFQHFPLDDAKFHKVGSIAHNEFDARWKIEKERMLRNGSHNISESGANFRAEINQKTNEFKEPKQESSQSFKRASHPGSSDTKFVTTKRSDTPIGSSTVSNIIKLHQPIRKSRILVVSGLPEDSCMSMVVEAFEKLGKITDFQKSEKEGTFTISYSSEADAVTAKRNLHRSCLAGKRITVEYVYQ